MSLNDAHSFIGLTNSQKNKGNAEEKMNKGKSQRKRSNTENFTEKIQKPD